MMVWVLTGRRARRRRAPRRAAASVDGRVFYDYGKACDVMDEYARQDHIAPNTLAVTSVEVE